MKFILGLFVMAGGGAIIYYSRELANVTGRWKWAEDVFGSTASGFAMVGMGLIILGIFVAFGVV